MTNAHDPFSEQLTRLLDDAASGFDARPDVPRFQRMLGGAGRRKGVLVVFSAAACLALVGGAAVAINSTDDNSSIAPAVGSEQPSPTPPKEKLEPTPTSEKGDNEEPDETQPPKNTEPDGTQPPKDTEPGESEPPKGTEPTPPSTEKPAPPTTEKPAPPTTEKPAPPTTEKPPSTEPPKTDPPTTEPSWEWSANQAYGVCEEDPPYDVFWGTTAPGAKVRIESAYGSGYVYADEEGHWEVTIYFPEAPVNQPFQVWVSSEGHLDDFWFKRKG